MYGPCQCVTDGSLGCLMSASRPSSLDGYVELSSRYSVRRGLQALDVLLRLGDARLVDLADDLRHDDGREQADDDHDDHDLDQGEAARATPCGASAESGAMRHDELEILLAADAPGSATPNHNRGRGRLCLRRSTAAREGRFRSRPAIIAGIFDQARVVMTFGFVFPGQGSQSVGMLAALAPAAGAASAIRDTFAEASAVLGYDLWQLVAQGPAERLNATECTQPAMLAAAIATWRLWRGARRGASPRWSAATASGSSRRWWRPDALDFAAAVDLVQLPGPRHAGGGAGGHRAPWPRSWGSRTHR